MTKILLPPIAVLRPTAGIDVQGFMARLALLWQASGVRVVGIVEVQETGVEGAVCGALALRNLTSGEIYSISQDLGSGSLACNLDPSGISAACHAVESALHHGCDIVILSKFAKQEASGSGLVDAYRQAILAGIPVVTAVSQAVKKQWERFSDGLWLELPPDMAALEVWRRAQLDKGWADRDEGA